MHTHIRGPAVWGGFRNKALVSESVGVCVFCGQSQREAHGMSTVENEIPAQTIAPSGRHGVWRYCCSPATERERRRRRRKERSPELRMFSILERHDFSPTAWSFQSKWQGYVSVHVSARITDKHTHTHTHAHTQEKGPFNQSLCPGVKPAHSYTSGVACAYFISPTTIDSSSEGSPCFISLSRHRSAKRLLPWTSTGSHSI